MNDCFGANRRTSESRPSWQVYSVSEIHSLSLQVMRCKEVEGRGWLWAQPYLLQLFLTFSPLTLPIPVTYPFSQQISQN